jgi:hypothetical protein
LTHDKRHWKQFVNGRSLIIDIDRKEDSGDLSKVVKKTRENLRKYYMFYGHLSKVGYIYVNGKAEPQKTFPRWLRKHVKTLRNIVCFRDTFPRWGCIIYINGKATTQETFPRWLRKHVKTLRNIVCFRDTFPRWGCEAEFSKVRASELRTNWIFPLTTLMGPSKKIQT